MRLLDSILADAPTAVVNMAMEGDLELRKDHSFTLPFLTGQERVAWVENPDPVALQVWTPERDGKVWTIQLGYVRPEYRNLGHISHVRQYVRELARKDTRCQFIEFLVSADNQAMIKSLEKAELLPANFHYRWSAK